MELNGEGNRCSEIRNSQGPIVDIVLQYGFCGEREMAKIIQFPVHRVNSVKKEVRALQGVTAEIIIFPGIRFEYHGVSFAIAR